MNDNLHMYEGEMNLYFSSEMKNILILLIGLLMMNVDVKGWIITIVDDIDKGGVREWCNNRNVDRTDLV